MKIVHLCYDLRGGGASQIALSLHEGLNDRGVESLLITSTNNNRNVINSYEYNYKELPFVQRVVAWIKFKIISKYKIKLERDTKPGFYPFSIPFSIYNFAKNSMIKNADVLHLHLISDYFDFSDLASIKCPVVITLHDLSTITGGCVQPVTCEGYNSGCTMCPQLSEDNMLASKFFNFKKKYFEIKDRIYFVAPSRSTAEIACQSLLSKEKPIRIISHGFRRFSYSPTFTDATLFSLGLNSKNKILLTIADHFSVELKGKSYVNKLLTFLINTDWVLLTVGNYRFDHPKVINLGFVDSKERLTQLYNIAHFVFIPSLAETFGNTFAESLLCGTPIICFDLAPMNEHVINEVNGYAINIDFFDNVIPELLSRDYSFNKTDIAEAAKEKYAYDKFIDNHIKLYQEII